MRAFVCAYLVACVCVSVRVSVSLFAKISQSEYAKACFIINEIDIAKLNLPPRCVKIIRFSSLAQPEVGAAYVTAGTLFLAGRR